MATTDYQILRSLLDYGFFETNREYLSPALFEDVSRDVYDVVVQAHEEAPGTDLDTDTLYSLWLVENPVATRTEREFMRDFMTQIADTAPMPAAITRHVIKALWSRRLGREIANYGIQISEGEDRLSDLRSLIERASDGYGPDEFGTPTPHDLDTLLELTDDMNRFAFNIPTLKRECYGLARSEFGIIFATPETGKTAFSVSVAFGPDGYAAQGARTLYLANEEKSERTMLRAISAYTGMSKRELAENRLTARQKFAEISDRVFMKDIQGWTLEQVEAYVKHIGADVVVIDQADKVAIGGTFNAGHERLRALYTNLRELAKRRECALWAVSQASNDAAGRTKLTLHDMEGSKIGKAAEADLIIGIGKMPGEDDDPIRYVTLCKNKISGVHKTINCRIVHHLSRYEA